MCVCVYVCVCVFTYVCVYMQMYMSTHILCQRIYLQLCISYCNPKPSTLKRKTYIHTHLCVYTTLKRKTYIHTHLCVCIYECIYILYPNFVLIRLWHGGTLVKVLFLERKNSWKLPIFENFLTSYQKNKTYLLFELLIFFKQNNS